MWAERPAQTDAPGRGRGQLWLQRIRPRIHGRNVLKYVITHDCLGDHEIASRLGNICVGTVLLAAEASGVE